MKRKPIWGLTFAGIVLFILVSMVSCRGQLAADGILRVGFPLEFFSRSHAKGMNISTFSITALSADLLSAVWPVLLLYGNDILEKHFKANANIPASSRGEDWINYTPANSTANIIMFGSGWGDGIYPRYVGFAKNGQVVKLIVDFIQLTDSTNEEE